MAMLDSNSCASCGGGVARVGPLCSANGTCAACLTDIHHAEHLGQRILSDAEDAELTRIGGTSASGYGELTRLGFKALCQRLVLTTDDYFVDLGSGGGRIVLQAAREHGVRCAIGIELARSRHELAVQNLAREPSITSRVRLVCGNIADARYWNPPNSLAKDPPVTGDDDGVLAGATVVFLSSLLFGEELMASMAKRIASCASVRVVATLQRFPAQGVDGSELPGFHHCLPTERCETSWMVPRDM